MFFHAVGVLACLACFSTQAFAQFDVDSLSFGNKGNIAPAGASNINGWQISGEGYIPQILSDRVILTPPSPANKRGALWTDNNLNYAEWQIDMDFRASGPERGSGNLNLWLTKQKTSDSGLASVYTVDNFDGLVLVIDQYGGSGGSIRGFLSDGALNYRTHHNVDSLAFGHCEYSYRNLGRTSKLSVKQHSNGLDVNIDGRECFKSGSVYMPPGYFVGLSAASAENPDSFEVHKFVTATTSSITREEPRRASNPNQQQQQQGQQQQQQQEHFQVQGTTDEAKMLEILSRMQATSDNIDSIYRELKEVDQRLQKRHEELVGVSRVPHDQLSSMARRIEHIDETVLKIQQDIEGRDYQQTLSQLQQALRDTQSNLLQTLPQSMSQIVSSSTPRLGFFIFIVLAFQAMLAASYVVYKRRRANSPKKLL